MVSRRKFSWSALMVTAAWVSFDSSALNAQQINPPNRPHPNPKMAAPSSQQMPPQKATAASPQGNQDDYASEYQDLLEDKEDDITVEQNGQNTDDIQQSVKQKNEPVKAEPKKPGNEVKTSSASGHPTAHHPVAPDKEMEAKFKDMHSKLKATHPQEAKKLESEYHASADKSAVLAKWSQTAIESQDMLDAVEELHAIYQVLKNINLEAAEKFEKRVQAEKDPRKLLVYAHGLLLKSLKDRKSQIATARSELTSISTILEYVDHKKAEEILAFEKSSSDPRDQLDEAYDLLLDTLEKAHKEVGLKPVE
ncbi:hypothetical protein [Candidatus Odyssella thessalonicensis]|uniref:hypothetical protein n=1 Tax=Candidatus Odyssella thessalonicensis TaxID=84647 RepID=UPI000225AF7B|nr:hypothetical protein [Candidatus Odyssella thessalonicensis]